MEVFIHPLSKTLNKFRIIRSSKQCPILKGVFKTAQNQHLPLSVFQKYHAKVFPPTIHKIIKEAA